MVAVRYKAYKIYFYKTLYRDDAAFLATLCGPGGFPLRNFMEEGCPVEPLDPWHVYDVEWDVSERWRLDAGALGAGELEAVAGLVGRQEATLWDSREALLTNEFVSSTLVPCCNPPYCFCNY